MPRRAKIVATIGPACSSPDVLGQLLDAGVNVVRLNLSHGSHEDHRAVVRAVRELSRERGKHVSVLADLMGPRFRLGEIEERQLRAGETVQLGPSDLDVDLPVADPEFLDYLRPGERLLIDNGLVEAIIRSRKGRQIGLEVLSGGPVATRKGINLPDTDLPFSISEKDRADIVFAVAEQVDYLAVSFVGGPEDLHAVRALIRGLGDMLPLVAKLERGTVIRALGPTIEAADAVMVARGDLGVELPLHQVPVLQKRILEIGRQLGKPVIVATQMLESMMERPRPTRAESTDVANAVFDGADALMLSGETAVGRYPVETVATMARIITEAEAYRLPGADHDLHPRHATEPLAPGAMEQTRLRSGPNLDIEIPDTIAAAAVFAADRMQVRHLVAFSQGGFTARMIARYRPRPPIVVFTNDDRTARRAQLVWGVYPFLIDREVDHLDEVVEVVDRQLLERELAEPGDVIIVLMGDPIAERPLTNLVRIHRVRNSHVG